MIAPAITLLNEIAGSRYSNFSESESERSECPRLGMGRGDRDEHV